MALSKDCPRTYSGTLTEVSAPMQASTTIYAGGAISRDSNGEVGPLAASEVFAGFARKGSVAVSAADANVALYDSGCIELVVTGVGDNDDITDIVYAVDDTTFTLTASGAVAIGRVRQITDLTAGRCMVEFHADTKRDQVLA
jgi:hypothetical protein